VRYRRASTVFCGGNLQRFAHLEALCAAALQLRVLHADASCYRTADAQRLLRNEGVFAPLRVRKIEIFLATLRRQVDVSFDDVVPIVMHVHIKEAHPRGPGPSA
jgi:hypothetical protein